MDIKEFIEFHRKKIRQFWNILLRFMVKQRIKLRLKKDAEQKLLAQKEANAKKLHQITQKLEDSKKDLENLQQKYHLLHVLTGFSAKLNSTTTDAKKFDCKHTSIKTASEFQLNISGEKIEYFPVSVAPQVSENFHRKLFFNKKYLRNLGHEYVEAAHQLAIMPDKSK